MHDFNPQLHAEVPSAFCTSPALSEQLLLNMLIAAEFHLELQIVQGRFVYLLCLKLTYEASNYPFP